MHDATRDRPAVGCGQMRSVGLADNPQASSAGSRDAAQDRVMAARVDKHRVRLRVGIDAPGNPLD